MRLFIMGESRFAATFLRAALAGGHEVLAVCATSEPHPADPLTPAAKSAGLAVIPAWSIMGGAEHIIKQSGAELLVLANVGRIIPPRVLAAAPRGAICFHPSLLPKYRGKRSVADAVKAGESQTGVTIFWPDEGADTGPVLFQVPVTIAGGESPAALYHDKLVPVGVYLMMAAVSAIAAGCAPRTPQPEVLS